MKWIISVATYKATYNTGLRQFSEQRGMKGYNRYLSAAYEKEEKEVLAR